MRPDELNEIKETLEVLQMQVEQLEDVVYGLNKAKANVKAVEMRRPIKRKGF